MRLLFLFAISFLVTCDAIAQDTIPKDTTREVLSFAEWMPQFPGGDKAFTKYLQKNIDYPDSARILGHEGTVYIYFVVNSDGSISDVRCSKGVPGAPELAEEAVRVVKAMPNWIPGKMSGRNVTVSQTVPIRFQLGRKNKHKK